MYRLVVPMRIMSSLIALALATGAAAAQEPHGIDDTVISCAPSIVPEGGDIEVRLGKRHGRELAVYREADRSWFFLVVDAPPADTPQLMAASEFADASVLTLGGTLESVPWASGGRLQRVFSLPGSYRIIVGDNLESEHPGHFCKIRVERVRSHK